MLDKHRVEELPTYLKRSKLFINAQWNFEIGSDTCVIEENFDAVWGHLAYCITEIDLLVVENMVEAQIVLAPIQFFISAHKRNNGASLDCC
jgi:hypothetical protein